MTLLVKLGGTLLDEDTTRHRLAGELAAAAREGHRLVVVHGGGKQMTRFLAQRGIESRFVDGLRVSTPEVIDAVLKVVRGSVNAQLVAALVQAGAAAVGLSGLDDCLVEAEQLSADLEAVGRPIRANAAILQLLTEAGFTPVVACVAGDRSGNIYNVNADQMAVACAAGIGARRLLFLTDVEGVRNGQDVIASELSPSDCEELIAAGVATGGMRAKLNAAMEAVRGGAAEVRIAPGASAGIIGQALRGEPAGTSILKSVGAAGERHGNP